MSEEMNVSKPEDVAQLKDVVALVIGVYKSGREVMADGKVGLGDLGAIVKLAPTVAKAIDGMGEVPAELKDLNEAEAAELVAFVMTELALEDAKAKLVVEKALKVAVAGFELVKVIKA